MAQVVLYHANCIDGFTAAWCAWRKFGHDAEYVAAQHGEPPPDVAGKEVYIVDFSYPREVLLDMAEHATSIVLLDHHRSAQHDLEGLSVRYLPLASGGEAIIDARDHDCVSMFSWTEAAHGGAVAYTGGGRESARVEYLHRLLLEAPDGACVDHVNRNQLDNRRCNLRLATKQQNCANMDRGSAWKGVTRSREKWRAQITVDGQNQHLGTFGSAEDAARAYDAAAIKAFGPYARGNFILPPEPAPPPPRNLHITFDMERSGAGLAFDHFSNGNRQTGVGSALVNYVEDRDLWRFQLADSREVNAFINTFSFDFETWTDLSIALDNMPHRAGIVAAGQAVLRGVDRYVASMKKQARPVTLAGYTVACVNAPYINTSELVGALAEDAPGSFAVGWFQRGDGRYQYSLRSRGDFDVSAVAEIFGGGGHKNAAGFTVDRIAHQDGRD